MEVVLNRHFPDRIVVIKEKKFSDSYIMEGMERDWRWQDYMIEGLVENEVCIMCDLAGRFELMDFDD